MNKVIKIVQSPFNSDLEVVEGIVIKPHVPYSNKSVTVQVNLVTTVKLLFTGIAAMFFLTAITCTKDPAGPVDTGSVTDVDGNVYHSVIIGTQEWMVENLKTTKYNDGTSIPLVTDSTAWPNLSTPGYCWYNNDAAAHKATYGALYNWYAVNTGKLAPTGWHVPTDSEWTIITAYLGGDSVAGGKLMEAGTVHWTSPNIATNETGFTALPGGSRGNYGMFYGIGYSGYWWSATAFDASNSWHRQMNSGYAFVYRYSGSDQNGYSVRCVRDP